MTWASRVFAHCVEQALDQMGHAFTDEAAHRGLRQWTKAMFCQNPIGLIVDVGRGIDQRAVEIKDNGSHRAAFAALRMARILAP